MRRIAALVLATATIACDAAPSDAAAFREESQAPDPAAGFVPEYDLPPNPVDFECEHFIQNCPAGMKCMPWSNDGGGAWNSTRCSPLAEDPRQIGQSCTVEGSGVCGIDDCRRGAMCWRVDPETNMGTCFAIIRGNEANPICPDPFTVPLIAGDGAIALCLPMCDPLAQDCPQGRACYPYGFPVMDRFFCQPDVSGDAGAAGDPCEFVNVCDPGTACLDATAWPDCRAAGCCTPYCDTSAPDCPAGTECTPWYETEGDAPPGFANVGVCRVPG